MELGFFLGPRSLLLASALFLEIVLCFVRTCPVDNYGANFELTGGFVKLWLDRCEVPSLSSRSIISLTAQLPSGLIPSASGSVCSIATLFCFCARLYESNQFSCGVCGHFAMTTFFRAAAAHPPSSWAPIGLATARSARAPASFCSMCWIIASSPDLYVLLFFPASSTRALFLRLVLRSWPFRRSFWTSDFARMPCGFVASTSFPVPCCSSFGVGKICFPQVSLPSSHHG